MDGSKDQSSSLSQPVSALHGASSEAAPYVPVYDIRNEPDYWTAGKIIRAGNTKRVWAICDSCGDQRCVDLVAVVESGHGEQPIRDWPLKCKSCGGKGHAKMTWVNPPRKRLDRPIWLGKERPGWYDFSTGKRQGAWD